MANRFKAKRSESVITQRPPEISGSKNNLAGHGRGAARNTSIPSNGGGSTGMVQNGPPGGHQY